jgi:hypothetical protein
VSLACAGYLRDAAVPLGTRLWVAGEVHGSREREAAAHRELVGAMVDLAREANKGKAHPALGNLLKDMSHHYVASAKREQLPEIDAAARDDLLALALDESLIDRASAGPLINWLKGLEPGSRQDISVVRTVQVIIGPRDPPVPDKEPESAPVPLPPKGASERLIEPLHAAWALIAVLAIGFACAGLWRWYRKGAAP